MTDDLPIAYGTATPSGWVQAPLIDLLSDLITGKRPKGGVKDITEGVLSLGGEHISSDGRLKLEKPRYIPHEFAQSIKHALIRVNDILIVKDGATTGKTAFIFDNQLKEVAYINEHLFICRSCKEIHPLYLFYFLRSEIGNKAILSDFRGAAQGGISREFVHKVIVPCAPLNEQRRIVEKLDRIIDRLRRARHELSHIKKLIDRYRQAILTAAFRGDLTADWRENKVSYDLSLGSFNCEIDEKGWLNLKAEDVCSVQCGSTPKGKPFTDKGDIPYLKVYNIVDQKINFDYRPQFIPYEVHQGELKRCITLPGDILINIVGPPLGKVAIVTNQFNEWNINQALVLFRPRKMITKEYLYYFLREGQFFRTIENKTKGTVGQVNISLTQCRNCVIPIPPFEEQKEIVRRIEERFAKIEKIEQEYQKAVKLCDRLEQETLAKAFRGELVPQDPNDEPASVLLERIRAEQQAKTKAKTAKSKKRSAKK